MNYVQEARQLLQSKISVDDDLLNLYTLLVFVHGESCRLEHVHDAWALWRNHSKPDHPSLVPFKDLDTETKELDRKYTEAIQEVAKALS